MSSEVPEKPSKRPRVTPGGRQQSRRMLSQPLVNSDCLLWPGRLTACECALGLHTMTRDSVLAFFLVMLPLLIKLMPALAHVCHFWFGMHFCLYKSVAFFWVLCAFLLILPLLIPSFPTLVIKLKFSFDDWVNTPELSSLALVDPLSSKKVAGLLVETAVLQSLYSSNILRVTGGCFLFLWLRNYVNFFD